MLYLVAGRAFFHSLSAHQNGKFPWENDDAHEWQAEARQMEMEMVRQLKSARI